MNIAEQCGTRALDVFVGAYAGIATSAAPFKVTSQTIQRSVEIRLDSADSPPTDADVEFAAKALAESMKYRAVREFMALEIPDAALSSFRAVAPSGISIRSLVLWSPPVDTKLETGELIHIPPYYLLRLDVAGVN